MKKLLLSFLGLFLCILTHAQVYTTGSTPYNIIAPVSPVNLTGGDDVVTPNVPIGFTFPFYCTNYTTCHVTTNGWLSFNAGISPTYPGGVMPNNPSATTIIAWSWDDMYTTGGGPFRYFVSGVAPNRIFCVDYFTIGYCCSPSNAATVQVQLFETTGEIRIMSANNNHAGRTATMGIQSAALGTVVVGRNATSWVSAANEGIFFMPPPGLPPTVSSFAPASACPGGTVVITGTGFTNASGVTIGGTPVASFVINSPTQITAVVGAGATGTIAVTAPCAGTGTSVAIFTINAFPNPPNPVTATPNTWCGVVGTSQLNAVSAGNTIQWYSAAVGGVLLGTSASGVNFPVNPIITTIYYAQSLNGGGCASLSRTPVTITVANPNLSIVQNPAGAACGVNPTLTAIVAGAAPAVGTRYYIRDADPWGSASYVAGMNAEFGVGNWTPLTYGAALPGTVFVPGTQFVYLEGSSGTEAGQTAYLAANLPAIETWVNNGGRLLINRGPNTGGNTSFGFGGVLNDYSNPQGTVNVSPGHPITTAPFTPAGAGPYTGGSYSHAHITGGATTPIITGGGFNVLTEKNWGNGLVMFGGYTAPSFHGPSPNAQNLFQNWLHYCATSAQGPAVTYVWQPGGATTASIVVNATGIYTVTATQAGCSISATISVSVNPNPTVAATSPTPVICMGSSANLVATGNGLSYTWNPGGLIGANQTVTPAVSTIYTVTALGAGGCTATSIIAIAVSPMQAQPAPVTATPSTVCGNVPSQLNAVGTLGSIINWYTVPNGGVMIGTSPSGVDFAVNPAVTTTYYAEAYSNIVGTQTFTYTGSMQTFTVPAGVTSITADVKGAQGGTGLGIGGNGARMQGTLAVTPGQVLSILVGQKPANNGGGGGTFVVAAGNVPQIIAGGGGGGAGSCCGNVNNGQPGVTATSGTAGVNAGGGTGVGGVGGNGGQGFLQGQSSGAGGGLLTSGGNGDGGALGGQSFLLGGAGGAANNFGGYGGGGSSHCAGAAPNGCAGGGGGGYSGGGNSGGGPEWGGGGGGGSYSIAASQVNTSGFQTGNGEVVFTWSNTTCPSAPRVAVTVTVMPPPPIVTAVPPSITVCEGTSVTLAGFSAPLVPFSWSGGIANNVAFTPLASTTYTVTGTDGNGCTGTATAVVTVNPINTGIGTAAPSPICLGSTTTVTASATPSCSGNISNFAGIYAPANWAFSVVNSNGTVNAAGAPASIIITSGTNNSGIQGSTNYSKTVGCAGTVTFNWAYTHADAFGSIFDYPRYTINGGAPVTFTTFVIGGAQVQNGSQTIAVNNGDVLELQMYTIDNDLIPGIVTISTLSAPALGYTGTVTIWDSPFGGVNFGASPQTVTPATAGTVNYYVEITSNGPGSCINPIRVAVPVTVNTATVTASASPATICEGLTSMLMGSGAATYLWNPGALVGMPTVTPLATTTYSVTGTDGNGCTGTTEVTVTVLAAPIVTATATPSTTCNLTSVTPIGGGAATYAWTGGVFNNVPFIATATTTYTVTGTDGFGCDGTTTVMVTVNPMSGLLAPATTSQTQVHGDDFNINYYDISCDLIATVDDGAGGNVLGSTISTVTVDATAGNHNGQPFVRRWYQITPTSIGGADVILYFNQSDFTDYNAAVALPYLPLPTSGNNLDPNIGNIRITKNADAGLGNLPIVITPSSVNWNGTYWELTFNTPGFSQFRVHSVNANNAPLPASVTNFSGLKLESSDKLSWTTSSEQNNAYFNLQHSTDGTNFTTLARVDSKAPNGNSAVSINYSSINAQPNLGHNYYRLQNVDVDSKVSVHAEIVDLIWGANGSTVSIYPNPTTDILNIDLYVSKAQNTTVKLLDMSGRVIKQIQAKSAVGMNNIKLSMGEIASGVYTIQVYENNNLTHTSKVKKND